MALDTGNGLEGLADCFTNTTTVGTGPIETIDFSDDEVDVIYSTIGVVVMPGNGNVFGSLLNPPAGSTVIEGGLEVISYTDDEGLIFDPADVYDSYMARVSQAKVDAQAVANTAADDTAYLQAGRNTLGIASLAAGVPEVGALLSFAAQAVGMMGQLAQGFANDPPRSDVNCVSTFTLPTGLAPRTDDDPLNALFKASVAAGAAFLAVKLSLERILASLILFNRSAQNTQGRSVARGCFLLQLDALRLNSRAAANTLERVARVAIARDFVDRLRARSQVTLPSEIQSAAQRFEALWRASPSRYAVLHTPSALRALDRRIAALALTLDGALPAGAGADHASCDADETEARFRDMSGISATAAKSLNAIGQLLWRPLVVRERFGPIGES